MKTLLKVMAIAVVLDLMLIDVAGARPKSPKRNVLGLVALWCNENGGIFNAGSACFECEIKRPDGNASDVYSCCESSEDGSVACGWQECGTGGSPPKRLCGPKQAKDFLPNVYRELLRSREVLESRTKVSAQPDLVPLPAPASMPPEGFCRRNDQGQLLVKIYNQGGGDAAATKTRVQFGSADPTDFDTPAIAAGSGTELVIAIPNACYDANNKCAFMIGGDATAAIAESNETNNNAAGLCGPQFS